VDWTREPGWYADGQGGARWWDGANWDPTAGKPPKGTMIAGGTPAGWYPNGVNSQTYWDGRAWTDQHAPLSRPPRQPASWVARLGLAASILAVVLYGAALAEKLGYAPYILVGLLGLILGIVGTSRSHFAGGSKAVGIWAIVLAVAPFLLSVVSYVIYQM
jgi:hypothetical protein